MTDTILMLAKFRGTCKCGGRFMDGDSVLWDKDTRKVLQCPACRPIRKPPGAGARTINQTPLPEREDLRIDFALPRTHVPKQGWHAFFAALAKHDLKG